MRFITIIFSITLQIQIQQSNGTFLWNSHGSVLSSASSRTTITKMKAKSSFSTSGRRKANNRMNPGIQEEEESSTTLKKQNYFFSQKDLTDFLPLVKQEDANLFRRLCEAAPIQRPSRIQTLSWPALFERKKNVIIGEQTGSGKTLAYLIPLLHRMIASSSHNEIKNEDEPLSTPSPKLVILTPTTELALQVRRVCTSIAAQVPFSTACITSSEDIPIHTQIRQLSKKNPDVLVSTPGRLATLLRSKSIDLQNVLGLVLDEVDVLLLDETFVDQLRVVGSDLDYDHPPQFVFVTATLPQLVVDKVRNEFENVHLVKGPGLHRVTPTVTEFLVDVSVPPSISNRDIDACLKIKYKNLLTSLRKNRCQRTLIFCNTVQSCRNVENYLNRQDKKHRLWSVTSYHGAMSNKARTASLQGFLQEKRGKGEDESKIQILVCTDRAARGVDFGGKAIDHVLIFDFPKDPAEYVRRVGRTARAGRSGICTVFAYGWQLPIARKIIGKAMDGVTNDIDEEAFVEDDDFIEEYVSERRNKNKRKKEKWMQKDKDEVIGANIEGGRLWKERKVLS